MANNPPPGTDGLITLDAGALELRPIQPEVARTLLDGRIPAGLTLAEGYPSEFSLETMQLVVDADDPGPGGPFFMVRKADDAVVGEIGCSIDPITGIGHVGYTVVEPSWGLGYASQSLRAVIAHVLAQPGVQRVVAQTTTGHSASRRVMEKAGMHYTATRPAFMDGKSVEMVSYQT